MNKDYIFSVDSTEIWRSNDGGKSWTMLCCLPYYTRDIMLVDSNVGLAVAKSSKGKGWSVIKTVDGGKHWQEVFKEINLQSPVLQNSNLFYLLDEHNSGLPTEGGQSLACRNMEGDLIKMVPLPPHFDVRCFAVGKSGEIW